MTRKSLRNGSRTVYTSGVSEVEKAMWNENRRRVDGDVHARSVQLQSYQEPQPSQKYTYQRGLAKAALKLPEQEQVPALAEVLEAMGLRERYFRA